MDDSQCIVGCADMGLVDGFPWDALADPGRRLYFLSRSLGPAVAGRVLLDGQRVAYPKKDSLSLYLYLYLLFPTKT